MSQKLVIDPVTRVEGHGKVTIHLDDQNKVKDAFFHVVEFRGFERFIQGHPYWEAPVMVQRLCGICPVSHHLAAAKAIDQIVGIDPDDLSLPAQKIRKLLHFGQVFQSHALHFFYLASPDLLFGYNADPVKRNVVGVAMEYPVLAKKGILMRKFGQEIIKLVAGKRIHGISATPGGVHKKISAKERTYFLDGKDIPSIDTMIEWSKEIIDFIKTYHEKNKFFLDTFAAYPSGHLGLVKKDNGFLDLYDGHLRALNSEGELILPDIPNEDYSQYFYEGVEKWSYLKFPYLKHIGREKGWNRVGPLARINVCDGIETPLAEKERQEFMAITNGKPNNMTMYTHWARLIEILYCAEMMKQLLEDDDILSTDLQRKGERRNEGIGIIEAPRGTLIHHYEVDDKDRITRCNLIVSTTHNNEAMNRAVRWVANNEISGKPKVTEAMLNAVEVAIRAYDPCLSCATHALGQMPLEVSLFNHYGELIHEKRR
ncbi:MAG: Ni/Fe hydrogenase subunit alpha [Bacteroidia bacterium]|nr:Ni/Fe hydrogenase subunit alpha [Bacteroidia bacterium]MBT8270075.1 Ni/Fe hydrogenase subunit alpha [Bacteroidia bacterium]NNK70698.1 Ni/Fe hydrogenase subunit alpha [Flavobacteriaceae bacterium]NNL81623.1 Ni/Fe hydrogenase subunit alpha [Flavobacteriaceae bacterium]